MDDDPDTEVNAEYDTPGDEELSLVATDQDGGLILGTADTVEDIELLGKWLRAIVSKAEG